MFCVSLQLCFGFCSCLLHLLKRKIKYDEWNIVKDSAQREDLILQSRCLKMTGLRFCLRKAQTNGLNQTLLVIILVVKTELPLSKRLFPQINVFTICCIKYRTFYNLRSQIKGFHFLRVNTSPLFWNPDNDAMSNVWIRHTPGSSLYCCASQPDYFWTVICVLLLISNISQFWWLLTFRSPCRKDWQKSRTRSAEISPSGRSHFMSESPS